MPRASAQQPPPLRDNRSCARPTSKRRAHRVSGQCNPRQHDLTLPLRSAHQMTVVPDEVSLWTDDAVLPAWAAHLAILSDDHSSTNPLASPEAKTGPPQSAAAVPQATRESEPAGGPTANDDRTTLSSKDASLPSCCAARSSGGSELGG